MFQFFEGDVNAFENWEKLLSQKYYFDASFICKLQSHRLKRSGSLEQNKLKRTQSVRNFKTCQFVHSREIKSLVYLSLEFTSWSTLCKGFFPVSRTLIIRSYNEQEIEEWGKLRILIEIILTLQHCLHRVHWNRWLDGVFQIYVPKMINSTTDPFTIQSILIANKI